MMLSLIVMVIDGSKLLRAANNLRCFTGWLTELSGSELPNSTVMGMEVAYLSLKNFISAAWKIYRSYVGVSLVEVSECLLDCPFWVVGGWVVGRGGCLDFSGRRDEP